MHFAHAHSLAYSCLGTWWSWWKWVVFKQAQACVEVGAAQSLLNSAALGDCWQCMVVCILRSTPGHAQIER